MAHRHETSGAAADSVRDLIFLRRSPGGEAPRDRRARARQGRSALACGAAWLVMAAAASAGPVGLVPQDVGPPSWPTVARPAPDVPSVLLIMTDDVGFGASSTFGGPVETPTFDALAKDGLRYNDFTTTGICSPSRAALLTGRNHNVVNVGNVMDAATGFDGYTSVIPKSAATGARLLADVGYSTAMFGKGHITPLWETGPSGPFDRWPTGLGFQYFYGFLSGDTNQWAPALYENTSPVDPPANDPNYILDRDLADRAIAWMRKQSGANPGKPFFIYYAPGTSHAPHHAPPEWIAKYKGRFDAGWDVDRAQTLERQIALGVVPAGTKLAARPAAIPAWSTLSAQQRRVYAHEMEVYAGALAFADDQVGRVVAEAKRHTSNLLVIYVQGDNGASAEAGVNGTLNEHALFNGVSDDLATLDARRDEMGSAKAFGHYSSGWAFAMDTPFPWFKQIASHYGATRNGLVISWPGHITNEGGIRRQFEHITDIMPTILEAAHVAPPAIVDGVQQSPLDGSSMAYTFNDPSAPSHRRTQYYLIWDNMAVYHDGWVAASVPEQMPWVFTGRELVPEQVDGRRWQLFDVAHDFSESVDLASKYPDKVKSLQQLFFAEAAANHALPVHRYTGARNRPDYNKGESDFRFTGPVSRIPEDVAPHLAGRSFTLTAKIEGAPDDISGNLMALGGRFGGMAWYVLNGQPKFEYNFEAHERTMVAGASRLSPGPHTLTLQFARDPGPMAAANVTMMVDGVKVAGGRVPRTVDYRFSLDESFDVGSDTGTPVSDDYRTPNRFKGMLDEFEIHLQ